MNPIVKAVHEVKYRIPLQILREVFTNTGYGFRNNPISLDDQIINQVIRPRVLVDCNLVGGSEIFVPLSGLIPETIDNYTSVFHVPKDLTQGRSIISVLSISYNSNSMLTNAGMLAGVRPGSVNPTSMAGMAMMDSFSPLPISSTAKVQLIGENTIMIKDTIPLITNSWARCVIANDSEMNNIPLRAIPHFCKLVELAVKSYIYNEYIIKLDMAQLSGGQELGKFKEIVESYSEVGELYDDYLITKWQGVAFMSDRETFTRFIKLNIGAMR